MRAGLRLNEDNIKKVVAYIWIASVVICFPEFFLKEGSEPYEKCIGPWSLHMNQASKVYIIIHTAISCIQLAVILYCYTRLIKELYFKEIENPEIDGETTVEKKKLVITFLLATTGFFVGYSPTEFLHSFVVVGTDLKLIHWELYSDLAAVFDVMYVCSLCFNPIIYSFRGKKFKEWLKRMISCSGSTTAESILRRMEMAARRPDARK